MTKVSTSRPLRVCLIAPLPPPYGGIGHWTAMVLRHVATRDDVKLGIINISPRWRAIDDMAIWKRAVGGGFQLLRDFARFIFELRHHPRAIHLTTSGQLSTFRDLLILGTARCLKIPVIYNIRFGRIPQLAGGISGEWNRLSRAMRLVHTVVVLDKPSEQAIRNTLPNVRVIRIPNCYEHQRMVRYIVEKPIPRTAVFIGWIIPSKGIEELVSAWKKVSPEGWSLQIIGPGRPEYQTGLISKYGPRHVEFLGQKSHDQAMEYLAKADLFIFPSHTEGFPFVILEAMALGKPIIASTVGAIPDMLEGECGILVPPRDVEALASALAHVAGDPETRFLMGERARKRAMNNYDIKAVLPRYISLWHEAAGTPL